MAGKKRQPINREALTVLASFISIVLIASGLSLLSKKSPKATTPSTNTQTNIASTDPNNQSTAQAGASEQTKTDTDNQNNRQRQTKLTLLGDTFSGYSTFRNTNFQETLKNTGITLDYADEFDQTRRAEQLNKGKADLIVTTLDQFLQQQPKGKIVGLLDRTVGADAMVLNTKQYGSLRSLDDLRKLVEEAKNKGEKLSIAYATGTPSEYLALVLDARFDAFNLEDFELKPVADASEAWALMQNPEESVAIAILWEPYVTQANQKGYNVVLSSKDAPNAIIDVVVASNRLMKSNPGAISELLESYYGRIDNSARETAQLQKQIAEDGELSIGDAAAIIEGIDFFTAPEAQAWLSDGTMGKRIGATAAVLKSSERIEKFPADDTRFYTNQFVTRAANNTQTLIDTAQSNNPSLAAKLAGTINTASTAPPVSAAQIQQAPDIGNLQVNGQVSFNTGSADLTEEGKQTLDQLANEMKEFNEQTVAVRVIGHTSNSGEPSINQYLSEQRARVAGRYLEAKGVAINILTEGKGSNEPLTNSVPLDPRNQRTEIRLVRVN